MNAKSFIAAIVTAPLLGVIGAFAAGWPALGVVLAAIAGEAVAYAGLQLWSRREFDRARVRALKAGENFLATTAVIDGGTRIRGLIAVLVVALGIAGLALLARQLIVAGLR
jgi:hypothetical protein